MTELHPWTDMAAPYALGALDPVEQADFEQHLAQCDQCRDEVDEMRETVALLAHAAPPIPPPPALRERILADARAVRPIQSARPAAARAPTRLAWLMTAASVALALLAGSAYLREREQRTQLAQANAEARAALASRDSLLSALLAPEVQTVRLSATGAAPSVRVYWNRDRRLAVLTAADLPPAPAGRTYQLWGIPAGGAPVGLGTFNTSRSGTAVLSVPVPEGVQLAVSAVTEEPEGGSPQPTSTPFLVGELGGE